MNWVLNTYDGQPVPSNPTYTYNGVICTAGGIQPCSDQSDNPAFQPECRTLAYFSP
jgi:hypothetical protein